MQRGEKKSGRKELGRWYEEVKRRGRISHQI